MSGSRAAGLARLCAVVLAGVGLPLAYPQISDQQHLGGRCAPGSTEVAGGTIVGIGGQVVAGGGGTGVGCDTFYAYEVRSGRPGVAEPFVEPGWYVNPGEPDRRKTDRLVSSGHAGSEILENVRRDDAPTVGERLRQ